MYIILPVFNILYYNFIRGMYRKCSRYSLWKSVGYTPCIHHIFLSWLKKRARKHKWMKQKLYCLILIDKSVRITASYNFQHIFFPSSGHR